MRMFKSNMFRRLSDFTLMRILIIAFMVSVSTSVFADPLPPCPPGNPAGDTDCDDTDPSIPFDGGASLIIAAGASLLGIKAFKKKKASDTNA